MKILIFNLAITNRKSRNRTKFRKSRKSAKFAENPSEMVIKAESAKIIIELWMHNDSFVGNCIHMTQALRMSGGGSLKSAVR